MGIQILTREEYEAKGIEILVREFGYQEAAARDEMQGSLDQYLKDEGLAWGDHPAGREWDNPRGFISENIAPYMDD